MVLAFDEAAFAGPRGLEEAFAPIDLKKRYLVMHVFSAIGQGEVCCVGSDARAGIQVAACALISLVREEAG